MRISAILAACCIFEREQATPVEMDLYAILLNACIYKRMHIKYIIGLIRVFALYFL